MIINILQIHDTVWNIVKISSVQENKKKKTRAMFLEKNRILDDMLGQTIHKCQQQYYEKHVYLEKRKVLLCAAIIWQRMQCRLCGPTVLVNLNTYFKLISHTVKSGAPKTLLILFLYLEISTQQRTIEQNCNQRLQSYYTALSGILSFCKYKKYANIIKLTEL